MLLFPYVELPDRTIGGPSPLLPLSAKDKDGWSKEEHHKLLNGNSGDSIDRVCDNYFLSCPKAHNLN